MRARRFAVTNDHAMGRRTTVHGHGWKTPAEVVAMMIPEAPLNALRRWLIAFNRSVDAESISELKWIYYPTIVIAGLYSLLVADQQTKDIANTLGQPVLYGWLALNVFCPIIALIGQNITKHSAGKAYGEDNYAVGGAWFQLWGDAGVFGAIFIALMSFAVSFQWGQPMYFTFYFLMGVPGGALFTYRSVRRLRQIKHRERRMP